jgi:hypothetical protein
MLPNRVAISQRKLGILFLVPFYIAVLLAGCAAPPDNAPQSVSPDRLRQLGQIGVISLLGNEMRLNEMRLHYSTNSALTTRYNKADVSEWNIDAMAISVAAEYLQSKGYQTKPVDYDARALFAVYTRDKVFTDKKLKRIAPQLQQLAKRQGIDTFVLLYRGLSEDFIGRSSDPIAAYGLYNKTSRKVQLALAAYAVVEADVVHAQSGRLLAMASEKSKTDLDNKLWHWDFEEKHQGFVPLSEHSKDQLEEKVKQTLTRSVKNVVSRVGFYRKL